MPDSSTTSPSPSTVAYSPGWTLPTQTIIGICAIVALSEAYAQPDGDIAFLSGSRPEILMVSVLHIASDQVLAVGSGKHDGRPTWSPDRIHIAHTFDQDGERRIRVVEANGANPMVIAIPTGSVRHPRWSPDGTRIAFESGLPNDEQVYVYHLATNASTRWGGDQIPLMQPAWTSQDRLVCVARIGGHGSQTTDLFWVTANRADRINDAMPDHGKYFEWAPTSPGIGDILAFESNDGGDREIFVYAPSRGSVDVTNHRAADWNPRWSPNRRTIAFESFRGGRRGVYQVNALRVLVSEVNAPHDANTWDPDWSPDGEWIVYVSDQTGIANLFASAANGKETVKLSNTPGLQLAPAWRPSP